MENNEVLSAIREALGNYDPKRKKSEGEITLEILGEALLKSDIEPSRILAEAAFIALRKSGNLPSTETRKNLRLLENKARTPEDLRFSLKSGIVLSLTPALILECVLKTNSTIEQIHALAIANRIPIFKFLGLRNLSSFVGEIFASNLYSVYQDQLLPNPNQDGYPDLLAMTPEGRNYYQDAQKNKRITEKALWSPFPFGGIEVKATCGSTPPAKKLAKRGLGETRIDVLTSFDWKSHHRNTNNLLGIFWDFIDGLPTVIAAFYRNDLTVDDWGKLVVPKEGGGNTTSVSVMKRAGVKKMGGGWIVLPGNQEMLDKLNPILDLKVRAD